VRLGVETVAGYKDTYERLRESLWGKATVEAIVPGGADKTARMADCEPVFEAGHVHIVRGAWQDLMHGELVQFPHGKHDDFVDPFYIGRRMLGAQERQAITPEFNARRHVTGAAQCDPQWRHYVVGTLRIPDAMRALVVSQDFRGHWWCWRETAARQDVAVGTFMATLEALGRDLARPMTVIDPETTTEARGASVVRQMREHGIAARTWTRRVRTARVGTDGSVMLLRRLLAEDKIHILDTCESLIDALANGVYEFTGTHDTASTERTERESTLGCLLGVLERWGSAPAPRRARGETELMAAAREAAATERRTNRIKRRK
jgi:hypothetical protein